MLLYVVSNFIFIEMVLQIMFHVLCMLILMLRHEVLKALLLGRNCIFGDITVNETTSAYQATLELTSILFFQSQFITPP